MHDNTFSGKAYFFSINTLRIMQMGPLISNYAILNIAIAECTKGIWILWIMLPIIWASFIVKSSAAQRGNRIPLNHA